MVPFSKRNDQTPDVYRYDLPESTRSRLLYTIKAYLEKDGSTHIDHVFQFVHSQLLQRFGQIRKSANWATAHPNAVVDHFFSCPDEEVLDFLEYAFRHRSLCGGNQTIDAINRVFEQDNVGFELTKFVEIPPETSDNALNERPLRSARAPLYGFSPSQLIFPKAIRKDEKLLHSDVVQPCLHVLADPRFSIAREELLKAFEERRMGDYADCVTDAGATFETVMKTICTLKSWQYTPNKDACRKLVETCRDNGLFYTFYIDILAGLGRIRSHIGDAHGKGPAPEFQATKELADHMLYSVCASINLLISLAKL